jgi:hypothetical protein
VKKGLIALAVVVVLVGAAAAAVPILEEHAAAEIKTAMESDGTTKVAEVEVGLFTRRIVLKDLRFAANGMGGSAKLVEGRGLAWPLGELLSGRTPLSGWALGDPLQADHVEVKYLKIADLIGGGQWSADEISVEGLDLARFDGRYDGQFPAAVLTARTLAALTVRHLEARKAVAALPGTGDTIGAAHVAVDDYDRGRIGSLSLEGNEATAKDAMAPLFKVELISAHKLDWSHVLAALSAAGWVPGAPIGRIHLDDFSATGFGGETLSNLGISLKSVTLQTERESEHRTRSRLRIEGFVYSPPLRSFQNAHARLALTGMGLTEVKLDLDCGGSEDRQKNELQFGPCKLVGAALGELETSGRIVNADPAFWQAVDNGGAAPLGESKAALGSAKLVLVDKSLLERGLKLLSTYSRKPVAETRKNLAQEIRNYQPPDVMISQDLTKFLDTVARFVEQGGTLTIEAKPDPPIELTRLQSLASPGADVVGVLGLTATVSR